MLIKYDALSVEAMDKIHICIDLLCDYGYAERKATLKETYESILDIYGIERNDPKMWEMIWNHKVLSLFQMEKQSGVQGIALIKPKNVNELSVLNSVIRLMAPDKNSETPLVTWAKYRNDINIWINEMRRYGLVEEEIDWLVHHSAITQGVCESQEGLMSLVQEPRLGGNTLTFADKCRKAIAKKQGKLFEECENTFFENVRKSGCSETLAHYVWDVLLKMQRGYSFNRSHCLAYSLIGLQEMNLVFKEPAIFWNCACLISDSGVSEDEGTTDYKKIALAIGTIKSFGINFSLIDINNFDYSFKPDVENNQILYGIGALSGINKEIIEEIRKHEPYKGIVDFMARCPLKKPTMISLIKAGAFDKIDEHWAKQINPNEPRRAIMAYYISIISEPKTKLTLQNFSSLVQKDLIPAQLNFEKSVFAFNKYLKDNAKWNKYYVFNDSAYNFYSQSFDVEKLTIFNNYYCILQTDWDKIYQKVMDNARSWLKENQSAVLSTLNEKLFKETWNKYASGTVSAWEMDSLCFYYHEHELAHVNFGKYGIRNFFSLSEEPEIVYMFRNKIPIYNLTKIAGTVISKDDNKSLVTILTVEGVVNVRFTKDYYAMYNRQLSEVQKDGTKKIIEKSWFARGTKIMVQGFRRDDTFVTKKYASTGGHQLYKIIDVDEKGNLTLEHNRAAVNEKE